MRAADRVAWLSMLTVLFAAGCQKGPFMAGQQSRLGQQQPAHLAQMQDLDRRNRDLDDNNQKLHEQIAQHQQRNRHLNDEIAQLRQQLGDTKKLHDDLLADKQQADKKLEALQASTRYRGGATITANNSLTNSLRAVDMPGLEVLPDGDVIRIVLPADKLFQPGTSNLLSTATPLLDQVADSLARNYRNQRIGIEGHTDSAPAIPPYSSSHQLTAAQSSVVFERLTSGNRLPAYQLFTMSHGPNHPRFSNGDIEGRARNRRVELVVYPEQVSR